jgi:S1-C subfamily serine protease
MGIGRIRISVVVGGMVLMMVTGARGADPAATTAPAATASGAGPQVAPERSGGGMDSMARDVYRRVTPSLVGVKFTWSAELGRVELVGPGVVVSDDGLVMVPIEVVNQRFPDTQLKEFKIVIPSRDRDAEEVPAKFLGRDERNNVAFVKAVVGSGGKARHWTPVKFVDRPVEVGDLVYSVGLLGKSAGYESYVAQTRVAANVRGDIPMSLTQAGLTSVGSVVVDRAGDAVGWVNAQGGQIFLSTPGEQRAEPMVAIMQPPRFFTGAHEFEQSLRDPPTGESIKIPWVGLPGLTGLPHSVAVMFGLENQPAVQVGDVVPGSPSDKAGIRVGWTIVKMDGQALPRGDEPEDTTEMLHREIMRHHVGDVLKLSVMEKAGAPLKEIDVKLEERPPGPNVAKRFFAEDMGFGVHDVTFEDLYPRRKPMGTKGVVVTVVKPGAPASAAKLQRDDLVTEFNGQPVEGLDQFTTSYEELRKTRPTDAAVLVVMKLDGTTETIRIEAPQ